jgi:DNA-binding LytR/AlgR family response regulator
MRVLIAEDDILIAEHLHDIIKSCDLDEIFLAHTYQEIVFKLDHFKPDLVLLDIHMDTRDTGIEIAKIINNKFKIPFIFITAQSDKLVMDAAIETSPFSYIVKPFNTPDIYATIQLAKKSLKRKYVLLKDVYGEVRVFFDEILYIKSDGNYLEVILTEGKKVIRSNFQAMLNVLPSKDFVQVHRSYIVNMKHIQKIEMNRLFIQDEAIPCSKSKFIVIKERLNSK